MREIKFRAAVESPVWSGRTLVSRNSFTLGELWDRYVELEFADGDCLPFGDIDWTTDRVHYLQFTGLFDKNGVEIYEGDILGACVMNTSIVHCEVGFYNGCFIVRTLSGERFGDKLENHAARVAIIGNIYENPEFLKTK
jgi:uncharacterized phage protein (TIGR01671 family)